MIEYDNRKSENESETVQILAASMPLKTEISNIVDWHHRQSALQTISIYRRSALFQSASWSISVIEDQHDCQYRNMLCELTPLTFFSLLIPASIATFYFDDGNGKLTDENGNKVIEFHMEVYNEENPLTLVAAFTSYLDLKSPEKPKKE
ncbi:hypothetical protein BD560DRAFT_429536 [Blakeslea trispora]|nr:hypothetical protein BD560DRAFT_429536 [Blakeslea trispora]